MAAFGSMLADATLPPGVTPPAVAIEERRGVRYIAARWTPEALARLSAELASTGAVALGDLSDEALARAWFDTVEAFLDPAAPERRSLDEALHRFCALSPQGLAAALGSVLGGVAGPAAREILFGAQRSAAAAPAQATHEATLPTRGGIRRPPGSREASATSDGRRGSQPPHATDSVQAGSRKGGRAPSVSPARAPAPVVVFLASNLPALAVQPLLPALALRRPVLLKSPTAEPLFAPAFVAALVERLPALAPGIAAVSWPGGDEALEGPLLAAAGRIVAYGDAETIESLRRRVAGKLLAYGPKASLAVVGSDVDVREIAGGLARDVALFDQRGCLSIQAVYTGGDVAALAHALAEALAALGRDWPPGPLEPTAAAAVQQLRGEADLRGLLRPELPLPAGTVIVAARPEFVPSPGLRTVRVHALADLSRLPGLLAPWTGRLQGAALAGEMAWALRPDLERLGFTRCAPPGELQSPDALWHNGGLHPLAALAEDGPLV